jgi:glycosyltransferase involved in cell wall biosynthesis
MQPAKIIHTPRRYVVEEWGGTETVVMQLARQQKAGGLQPLIFTSLALSVTKSEVVEGTPVRRFSYRYPFFGLSPEQVHALDKKGGNMVSLSLFAALLREPGVRLFHAHAINRLGGMVRTAARLRKLPYVVSLHGGYFDVPAEEAADLQKPVAGHFEWGKPFGALFGSRKVLSDADYVICVGRSEAEKAAQALRHHRVAYLPNGVDTGRFAAGDGASFRHAHQIPQDAFLVLNLSRLDGQKNQLLLLEAFSLFKKSSPTAVLALMGPETQASYAAKLRHFIQQHGLQNSVRLIPGLPPGSPEVVNAYHACDVFVLPSIHEPFGIVVLEAWSSGKPVVASCVGGLKHLIEPGKTGLFIDPGDQAAPLVLSEQLRLLERMPSLRRQLGTAGQEMARERYSWERIWGDLEDIYGKAEVHAASRYRAKKSQMEPWGNQAEPCSKASV